MRRVDPTKFSFAQRIVLRVFGSRRERERFFPWLDELFGDLTSSLPTRVLPQPGPAAFERAITRAFAAKISSLPSRRLRAVGIESDVEDCGLFPTAHG